MHAFVKDTAILEDLNAAKHCSSDRIECPRRLSRAWFKLDLRDAMHAQLPPAQVHNLGPAHRDCACSRANPEGLFATVNLSTRSQQATDHNGDDDTLSPPSFTRSTGDCDNEVRQF